jgi:serine protease AprX
LIRFRSSHTGPDRSPRRGAWSRLLAGTLALAVVALAAPTRALEAGSIDAGLRALVGRAADDSLLPVIVTVKANAKRNVVAWLQPYGITPTQDFTIIQAFAVTLPLRLVTKLADHPDVISVSSDAAVTQTGIIGPVTGKIANTPYSLRATLGASLTGKGSTIAVIDSGIAATADFGRRLLDTRDFVRNTSATKVSALDPFGHGTHVAGLAAGAGPEVTGVAIAANLVSLRVLDGSGLGTTTAVLAAIQWAVANAAAYGIDILTLSLGHPILEPAATDPLVQAVEAAVRAGIVVVVAAGNVGINPRTGLPGYAGILSPGNAPSAITVGAVRPQATTRRTDDLMAEYSSRGPTWYDAFAKPDLVAPGHWQLAAQASSSFLYTNFPGLRGPTYAGKTYLYLSGTSMATPAVAGTVALVHEASRTAFGVKPTPNAVKAMLMHSAFKLSDGGGKAYDTLTQGAGALNAAGALQLAAKLDPRVATGAWWVATGITPSSTIDGQTLSWSNDIVWGTTVRRDAVFYNYPTWSPNIVWGTSENIVWGTSDNIVWGTTMSDNIVWGTSWGDNIVWGTWDNIVWGTSDNIVWGTLAADPSRGTYVQSLNVLVTK